MSAFNELIKSGQPVLVDFFAEWCGPCKAMAPVLLHVAGEVEGKARIIKVDVDKNPAAASAYQVRGVPTFILFKDGEVKWRQSGTVSQSELLSVISKYY
jgi:thioredoxin 1